MPALPTMEEYRQAMRTQVYSRCPDRPRDGPPYLLPGKQGGVELHLERLVDVVHANAVRQVYAYTVGF
ncbi:hypothetical protein [Lacipirellula limnantheis]|uniref:Uncharacterized protein n=1 Tax=Lacipirellula limnantheis TaxID=2528024 RepID=A0A517U4T0_9BACT|nr:hypothetical protein [Lacipirellula limnantheis]QDT75642.1 hypothetical protein I41_48820 [Lacipirellula limnantheis]